MNLPSQLTHIDLFAGCGGISLGLYNAGWKGVFALEKSPMAFQTLKHNLIDKVPHFDWPFWLPVSEHDIMEVLQSYRNELHALSGQVDLVVGGPPCQGFSFAGQRNEKDERNNLANSYVEFVSLVQPQAILFENVRGFTVGFGKGSTFECEAYSKRVSRDLQALGYRTKDEIVDFSEFGIPQARKRYLLAGFLSKNPDRFFEILHETKSSFLEAKGLGARVTLGEALSDLERSNGEIPSDECKAFKQGIYGSPVGPYQELMRKGGGRLPNSHRFANHRKKTIERLEYIQTNCPKGKQIEKSIRTKLGLKKNVIIPLDNADQCPTLTTLPDDYIHYSEPRILTVRECARIQSFPDWFEFKSSYTTGGFRRKNEAPRYTQVGNAVPPLFAELAGNVLGELI
jgi:DNA (cytosine-5)-methyltransferase 1